MSSLSPKIGLVTCDFAPPFGGMGRHLRTLQEGLLERGCSVEVFDATCRGYSLQCARNVGFSLSLLPSLRSWVQRHSLDLLHLHTGPGGVLLSHRLTIPTIVTAHHTYAQQSDLPWQLWKKLLIPWERATYRAATAIIAVSPDTLGTLVSRYGLPERNITTITPGFSLAPWMQADRAIEHRDRWSIIFIGRKGTRKGFDLLLEAWQSVHRALPHARLSIVGIDGVAGGGISYRGRVSDHDLQTLVGSSRCVVCPSRCEGFGLSAAEAIAAGTPVVCTNVAGLRSVLAGGDSGLLVSCDVRSITQGMIRMLQDDVLWNRCHLAARRERNRCEEKAMMDAHIALYRRVYSSSL